MALTIALDAIGGDHAPEELVRGAVRAARELGVNVALVGPEQRVQNELVRQGVTDASKARGIEVVSAEETIGMEEHPASAVRAKRGASVVVAARLVREGRAQGFVSAGNSGAAMAAALLTLGRVRGIERPALATVFPTISGRCLLLDAGANADCRATYLAQFAVMGRLYAERVIGIANPRIGLLNIGEEESKGSQAAQEAHQILKTMGLNFVGNVEGKDVPAGLADVVVADGFAGNVALKMAEGMGSLAFRLIREEVSRSLLAKLGALLMKPAFRRIMRRLDYEEYGGAPLLGVDGVVVIAHGRSRSRAIFNAIRVAKQSAEARLVQHIREGVQAAPRVPDQAEARQPEAESSV